MTNTENSDQLLYPTNHMSERAAEILVNASNAQIEHDKQWTQLQSFIQQNFTQEMRDTLTQLLQPYASHLRASLDWQMNLATAIFDATGEITGTDKNISDAFDPALKHKKYPGFQ